MKEDVISLLEAGRTAVSYSLLFSLNLDDNKRTHDRLKRVLKSLDVILDDLNEGYQ